MQCDANEKCRLGNVVDRLLGIGADIDHDVGYGYGYSPLLQARYYKLVTTTASQRHWSLFVVVTTSMFDASLLHRWINAIEDPSWSSPWSLLLPQGLNITAHIAFCTIWQRIPGMRLVIRTMNLRRGNFVTRLLKSGVDVQSASAHRLS